MIRFNYNTIFPILLITLQVLGAGKAVGTEAGIYDETEPDPQSLEIVEGNAETIKSKGVEALIEFMKSDLSIHLNTEDRKKLHKIFQRFEIKPLSQSMKLLVSGGLVYFIKVEIGPYVFHVKVFYHSQSKSGNVERVLGPKDESDRFQF